MTDIFYRVAIEQIRVFGCTICRIRVRAQYYLFTCKKLVTACVSGLLGANISIGSLVWTTNFSVRVLNRSEWI